MNIVISVLDTLFFIVFACNTIYVLFYSLAFLLFKNRVKKSNDHKLRKIGVLIPSYKEDEVIIETVEACLNQSYPKEYYKVVVIADHMKSATIEKLKKYPIEVLELKLENSTKVKSLNFALNYIDGIDIDLILDADNVMTPTFLEKINNAFDVPETTIVQGHRTAKNLNTSMAYLDAISEEINNSIFRQGHYNVGLSAALIGSGMAFCHDVLKKTLSKMEAVGGFDRALELTLLYRGLHIDYVGDAYVLDEKVQDKKSFTNQRRRWMSSQIHYLKYYTHLVPSALRQHKWDFLDKYIQQTLLLRSIMLGMLFIIAFVLSFYDIYMAIKWWNLFVWFNVALVIAIPKSFFTRKFFRALLAFPYSFLLICGNLFKMGGANKSFIHTPHGVDDSKK